MVFCVMGWYPSLSSRNGLTGTVCLTLDVLNGFLMGFNGLMASDGDVIVIS